MNRRSLLPAALLSAALFACPAAAQDKQIDVKRPPSDEMNRFRDFKQGRESVYTPATSTTVPENHKKLLQNVADYYVFRLTDPVIYRQSDSDIPPKPGTPTMTSLLREAEDNIPKAPAPPGKGSGLTSGSGSLAEYNNQVNLNREFGKAMENSLRKVLDYQTPIVKINAARMLPMVAKSGCTPFADFLTEILNSDKQPDAVKLFAAEGLKNLFAVSDPTDPKRTSFGKKEADREAKAVQALIAFILRDPKLPAAATEPDLDAVRYVRREAVRALGNTRFTVIRDGSGKPAARPALVLLKVALKDPALIPAPSVSERVEAFVGLMQLQPDPELDATVAAYFTAVAAVSLIGDIKQLQDEKAAGVVAWKVVAARLTLAGENWKTSEAAKKVPNGAKLGEVADLIVTEVAKPLEAGGSAAQFPGIGTITNWIGRNVPKTANLYSDDPASTLTVPRPGG